MATTRKSDYATLSTPGSKKVSVIARRAGSRERMTVIAVCTSEFDAERIVAALGVMQGKLAELEVPAQRVLEQVREQLNVLTTTSKTQAVKIRDLEGLLRTKEYEQKELLQKLSRAEVARDAAQKAAKENA